MKSTPTTIAQLYTDKLIKWLYIFISFNIINLINRFYTITLNKNNYVSVL